jgi:type IV pilus assembly protein PilN
VSLKLHVNLASEPFRKDRPILVGSALVALLLAALLSVQVLLINSERSDLADTRARLNRLERKLSRLQTDESRVEGTLRRPENIDVLDRSIFLNALLQRKAISWTRIFSDLETVVPHDVRLISIRPAVNAQNEIVLDMMVGAQSAEPVLKMMVQLEGSPLFGQTFVHNWLPPSQSDPLFKYRVSVNYAQKL